MVAAIAAAFLAVASGASIGVAAPKLPPAPTADSDDAPVAEEGVLEIDAFEINAPQTDAAEPADNESEPFRRPEIKAASSDEEPTPTMRKAAPKGTTSRSATSGPSQSSRAQSSQSSDTDASNRPSARRQLKVAPTYLPPVQPTKQIKTKIVAPGVPARANRPAPPAAPNEEIDDSGVGTGADAPAPPPEDAVPSLTESLNKSSSPSQSDFIHTPGELETNELNPQMIKLRGQIRSALGYYHQKRLNTRDHNPWEVMHVIVAYGGAAQLDRGQPNGQQVNAIGWLCWNGDCHGVRILDVEDGRVAARKGHQVQGHPGQFLAILAQSRVATSCPMKVNGQEFTLEELIESEKLGCRPKTELTFKLISLAYYLKIDERWKSSDGQDWSIDRLVQEELAQPIVGAACGGTHRLMGLAYAVRKREVSGLPVTGEFARARKFLDDFHRYAFKLQNADGSFSTEWFKGPGSRPDLKRRVQTSGHIMEWLAYSLPADQLDHPRFVKSITYLTGVLNSGKGQGWDVGPLGHALHALSIYDDRYFRPFDAQQDGLETALDDRILPTVGTSDKDSMDSENEPLEELTPVEVKHAMRLLDSSTGLAPTRPTGR